MTSRRNAQLFPLILFYVFATRQSSEAASVQLNFLRVDGLPLHVYSDLHEDFDSESERYRLVARECRAGICSIMGILSPNRMFTTLHTAQGLEDADDISIAIRLRRQSFVASEVDAPQTHPHSSAATEFKSDGAIRSGRPASGAGHENDIKRLHKETQDILVAEYVMQTSIAELRRCGENCVFNSNDTGQVLPEPKQAVRILSDLSSLYISYKLLLHEDVSSAKPATSSRLAAAYFAEHAEKRSQSSRMLLDWFEMPRRNSGPEPESCEAAGRCVRFKRDAAIRDGMAQVWYLDSGQEVFWHLNSSSPPDIVVAFRQPHRKHDATYESEYRLVDLILGDAASQQILKQRLGKVGIQYRDRYNDISRELRSNMLPGASVMLTGFSESAGMATVAFADFVMDDKLALRKVSCTVFSSPQIGDIRFMQMFHRILRRKPRYGYLERVVAAHATSKAVDPGSVLPSAISEHLGSSRALAALHCLPELNGLRYLSEAALRDLGSYAHVGRVLFLFDESHAFRGHSAGSPSRSRLENTAAAFSSRNDIYDFARGLHSLPASTDKLDVYIERLLQGHYRLRHPSRSEARTRYTVRGAVKHLVRLVEAQPFDNYPPITPPSSLNSSRSDEEKRGSNNETEQVPSNEYSIVVHVKIGRGHRLSQNEHLSVSLCTSGGEGGQMPICYLLPVEGAEFGIIAMPADPSPMLTFRTMRSTALNNFDANHIRLAIHRLDHSPKCQAPMSDMFPSRRIVIRQARKKITMPKDTTEASYGLVSVRDTEFSFTIVRRTGIPQRSRDGSTIDHKGYTYDSSRNYTRTIQGDIDQASPVGSTYNDGSITSSTANAYPQQLESTSTATHWQDSERDFRHESRSFPQELPSTTEWSRSSAYVREGINDSLKESNVTSAASAVRPESFFEGISPKMRGASEYSTPLRLPYGYRSTRVNPKSGKIQPQVQLELETGGSRPLPDSNEITTATALREVPARQLPRHSSEVPYASTGREGLPSGSQRLIDSLDSYTGAPPVDERFANSGESKAPALAAAAPLPSAPITAFNADASDAFPTGSPTTFWIERKDTGHNSDPSPWRYMDQVWYQPAPRRAAERDSSRIASVNTWKEMSK